MAPRDSRRAADLPPELERLTAPYTYVREPVTLERVGAEGWAVVFRAIFEPWVLTGRAHIIARAFTVERLSIVHDGGYSDPADRGLTPTTLQRLPYGEIFEEVRRSVVEQAAWDALMAGSQYAPSAEREALHRQAAREADGKVFGRGRPPKADAFYRDVAVARLDLVGMGHRGSVRRILAERLEPVAGFPASEQTVADWLREARKRGYLGPSSPGRRDATPGPRLLAESSGNADDEDVERRR